VYLKQFGQINTSPDFQDIQEPLNDMAESNYGQQGEGLFGRDECQRKLLRHEIDTE
jgi:hypothetical protein